MLKQPKLIPRIIHKRASGGCPQNFLKQTQIIRRLSTEENFSIAQAIFKHFFQHLHLHARNQLLTFAPIRRFRVKKDVRDGLKASHFNFHHVVGVTSAFEAVVGGETVDRKKFIADEIGLGCEGGDEEVGWWRIFGTAKSVFDFLKFTLDEVLKGLKIHFEVYKILKEVQKFKKKVQNLKKKV